MAISGTAAFSGIEANILLGGEAASMTVMDMHVAPGRGAPAHISFEEDKVFHIAQGAFVFLIGDNRIEASAGNHLFVERGTIHSFAALNDSPARMTLVSTPSGHDAFFTAMGDLPVPHNPDQVAAICLRYRQAIVGPVIASER